MIEIVIDVKCPPLPRLQVPHALHALRAPWLQSVDLDQRPVWREPEWASLSSAKICSRMHVHAEDLVWLLHHPCLKRVTITATQVSYNRMQFLSITSALVKCLGPKIVLNIY